MDEPSRLLLGEPLHGDARPLAQHPGDLLVADHPRHRVAGGPQRLLLLGPVAEEDLLPVAQLGCPLVVLAGHRLRLLTAHLVDLGVEVADVGRGRLPADPHARTRLVDEVDRLVGKETVGDVAVGEVGGSNDGVVGVPHRVVGLVTVLEALEDADGVGDARLVDLHRLEAALEGRVLLEVLAVLLEGGGADRLQLAPGKHRLEDRGGVDGSLGSAGPHERVDLVDEHEDVAAALDLLQHLLEALLEIASVAAARHQRPEVEGVELLALEGLGDITCHDALGEALDDGGLADAGFADEDRVVLGAAAQHLHDPLDLLGPADDRVELAVTGHLGEVATELVEDRRSGGLA